MTDDIRLRLDVLDERLRTLETAAAGAPVRAAPAGRQHSTANDWVEQWFAPRYGRNLDFNSDYNWCPRWWDHPEAVEAFDALWQGWEVQHHDPNKMLVWLTHLYLLLRELTGAGGTFSQCGKYHHRPVPLLCEPEETT